MNNTTHTPGPWKAVHHPREHKWAWTIEGADGVGQIIVRIGLVNDAQAVAANAHLIAAAPAMYEALQIMVKAANVDEIDPLVMFASIERAKGVLAQAEGHQHG